MSFLIAPAPTAGDFEAALRFIFEAWAALPAPADAPPDTADMELHMAFTKWREAKEAASRHEEER